MRYNGAQMIAFGGWGFGGDGGVVVTHSVYEDFDHWTATRQWGAFVTEAARVEETAAIRAVFAGRATNRTLPGDDDRLRLGGLLARGEMRKVGEPLAPVPPSFGRQSVVAETRFTPSDATRFKALTVETLWPWYANRGARPLIYGRDPLGAPGNVVTYVAFPDISDWHALTAPDSDVSSAWEERNALAPDQSTRLLMVQSNYGASD